MTHTEIMQLIFNIINSIGVLATFGAFLFLFRKDKDKQKQIDKLTSIATVLEAQNESLKKQNDLIAQQVEIFRNSSVLKQQDNALILKLQEIEEKKLKLSVAPVLWLNGAGTRNTGELQIDLNNKGERAILDDFILKSGEIELNNKSIPYDLEKGERRYIFGRAKSIKPIIECEYEIEVLYHDKLNNKFSLIITGKGTNVKIKSNNEINE
jgi:hypothetical protein